MADPLKKQEIQVDFTESTDMPTVTTLLQRKKLQNTSNSLADKAPEVEIIAAPQVQTPQDAIVIELDLPNNKLQKSEVEIPLNVELSLNTESSLSVKSISDTLKDKLDRRSQFRMSRWTRETLKSAEGPFARAIEILVALGAPEVLYFEEESKNEFKAYAAYAERDRMACWTGLNIEIPDGLQAAIDLSRHSQSVVTLDENGDWDQYWRRHLLMGPESKIFLIPIKSIHLNEGERRIEHALLSVHSSVPRFERICKSIQPLLEMLSSS